MRRRSIPQRQRTRWIWPLRQTWWSICSAHFIHDESCDLCETGTWRYDLVHWLSSLLYRHNPDLWRWWINRRRARQSWLVKLGRRH